MTAGLSAVTLTGDTPRWLFLTMLGLGVAAYVLCGLLVLGSRYRRARRIRRAQATAAVTAQTTRPGRDLVITGPRSRGTTR